MSFGSNLQSLRESRNLSQKELANQLGVSTGVVAEWESDESAPNIAELSRLGKALGVSTDDLLSDEVTATMEQPVVVQSTASVEVPSQPAPATKKARKKTGLVIGIVALCAVLVVGACLLVSGVFTPEQLPFAEDIMQIEATDASVVTLFCYDYDGNLAATGSGFVAFDGSTIVTNYHVMTSAYTCKISTNQDISYEVSKILCYSKEQDIAILQLAKDTGLQPLTLGESSIIKKGETVVAIGSPLGIKNTVSTGVLSGRLMENGMDVLQFTAPISSGSSGGALFDNNGNVIGITYASYIDGQNLNLAIPIELASELYNTKGDSSHISKIYEEEHPYVTKLAQYKDIPTITIDEFLENYTKYDTPQTVKIIGYISSIDSRSTESLTYFISPVSGISGNPQTDIAITDAAIFKEIPYQLLFIFIFPEYDYDKCFVPSDAKPGDLICWIGSIHYTTYSSEAHLWEITELMYPLS